MAEVLGLDQLSLEQLEREVTCGICQEHYTDPKILPCLHYYCKQCVLALALRTGIDKPFHCPECRCKITLREEGVEGLKSAFFINRFKSTFSTLQRAHGKVEVNCEACSNSVAEFFCRQCALFICRTCADSHLKMKLLFANHQVVSLQDLKESKAKVTITEIEPSPQKCPDHNEDMKIFCYDCNTIICRDCTVIDHKDHKFQFSNIAAPKVIENLKKELKPLKQAGDKLSRAVDKVKTTREEVEAECVGAAQTINTTFDEIVQIVEQRRKELLEKAGRIMKEKVDKLTVQEKTLSLANAEVQSIVDYTERCVSHCSGNEIMIMYKGMKEQIFQKRKLFDEISHSTTPVEEADLGVDMCRAEDVKQIFLAKGGVIQVPLSACVLESDYIKDVQVGKVTRHTLTNFRISTKVFCELKCLHNDSVIQCVVDQSGPGKYLIQYTPTVRGRHELTVRVSGRHIVGSPFPVFVSIHPSQLGKPVSVWTDLEQPYSLATVSKGDIIVGKKTGDILVFMNHRGVYKCINEEDLELDSFYIAGIETDAKDVYLTLADSAFLYKLNTDGSIIFRTLADSCEGHLGIALVGEEVMVCPLSTDGTIMVYTKELKYVRNIVGSGIGQLHDISSDSKYNLYVSDKGNRIHVFNNRGKYLRKFGCGNSLLKSLSRSLGLCVFGQYVYICNNGQDTGNHRIYVFTLKGQFVTKFGTKGKKNGQFNIPRDVCLDQDGFLYVAEVENNRIQKF